MSWKDKPTSIDKCDLSDIQYVIAMDETGTPTLKNISDITPLTRSLFTLTGLIIETQTINPLAHDILQIKNKYWENGMYNNNRVIFHSRDIRKKQGPYNPRAIDYFKFRDDLNSFLTAAPVNVCAACIDKPAHKRRYHSYSNPVYQLSLGFILERLTYRLRWINESCVIFLESRGHKEDTALLSEITQILENGSRYVSSSAFGCIKGIYFNKKLNEQKNKSYWPLELADIVSYRIHCAVRSKNFKSTDFLAIRQKLLDYPQFKGHGLKVFPKESTLNEF